MKSPNFFSRLNYFFLTIILVGTFIFSAPPANAQFGVTILNDVWAQLRDNIKTLYTKQASVIFQNVLKTALNKLAYDYATYLGSGAQGQQPMIYGNDALDRIYAAADSASGQFLEQLANSKPNPEFNGQFAGAKGDNRGKTTPGINLCRPDFSILQRITLGLTDTQLKPYDPGLCNFKNLVASWQGEYDKQIKSMVQDKSYLKRLSSYFDPGASDLNVTLELFGRQLQTKSDAEKKVTLDATETSNLKTPVASISKRPIASKDDAAQRRTALIAVQSQSFGKTTGDILVDASNIFLNQLALTAFNKLMSSIGNISQNDSSNDVNNPNGQAGTGGITELNKGINQLLQVDPSERSDYEVLGQLSSCPDKNNPGPKDCVIDENFAQAIEQQMTVGEAVTKNKIDADKRIGFNSEGGEIDYLDGYSYRTLIILRKYRVLPVGWEVASQYMKTHVTDASNVTLRKLLECYSASDTTYAGYHEDWCDGLIDPSWVLKLPKLYCGMEGYGPEIIAASVAPSTTGYCVKGGTPDSPVDCSTQTTTDGCSSNYKICTAESDCAADPTYKHCNFTVGREVSLTRNNNYCADEQSCIKENNNGSCTTFGYCTEEQRRWNFNQQKDPTCEPRNNTCQTFSSDQGSTASYLENTLDFSNCDANQVGCKKYATNGVYTLPVNSTPDKMVWSDSSTDAKYFNGKVGDCDPNKEGCHEFIRTKDNLGTNLIADGSFENSKCISNGSIEGSQTLLPNNDNSHPFVKQANAQTALGNCKLTTFVNAGAVRGGILDNRWFIDVPQPGGSLQAGIVKDKSTTAGGQSLYINGNGTGMGGIYSKDSVSNLLPTGFIFEDDRYYTLSAKIYVVNHSNPAEDKVKVTLGPESAETTTTDSWQSVTVIYYRPAGAPTTDFYIQSNANSTEFYLDDLQLTVGDASNSYSNYSTNNVVYEKLLPAYLEASCYINPTSDYRFKTTNLPDKCKDYARKCNADEVGCEKYTSDNTGIDVTAKIKPKDICPSSCVGYDVFVEQPTYFSISNPYYFIPTTATSCSAQAVGCTAFTNLDKLSQGGEAIEYYSYLRSCIKPDVASCGDYYTWEGSDEAGYQLKTYSLKKNLTTPNEPASTMSASDELAVCNEAIFKKTADDPGYNYDCREFYGRDGTVTYHLYTKTISCSDDCHPYRREATPQECADGNGTWDTAQLRCIYLAIPNEGTTCAAAEVGCREYTGNIANDTRTVNNKVYNFETSPDFLDGWLGGSSSLTSLNLGEHSLSGSNLSKFVGSYDTATSSFGVKKDESYTISFLAKSQTSSSVAVASIVLVNKDNATTTFSTNGTAVGSEWKLYTFNLAKLDHDPTPISGTAGDMVGEKLNINFSGGVYIDNIKLTEVPNRYFLIKDSWTTPTECDQTITGDYSPRYMLGCNQYKNSDNAAINLHSFGELCQDSAAGCEQMVDTQNSPDYQAKAYNDDNKNGNCDANETKCVKVAADKMINVAYDKTKLCGQEDRGCQRLGVASIYDGATTYTDVYKLNDPYDYDLNLCGSNSVGCSQWSDTNGATTYFKDPGNMVCEWRLRSGTSGVYDWFKKKVNRCDGSTTGALCNNDSDCLTSATKKCSLDNSDSPCAPHISYDKTIGIGGASNHVPQPKDNWAGTCNADQAGCSEYIDPISKFNDNLIANPGYKIVNGKADAWDLVGSANAKQSVDLYAQTIYILKGAGTDSEAKVKIDCSPSTLIRVLNNSNEFNDPVVETNFVAGGTLGDSAKSLEFYLQNPSNSRISCTVTRDNRTVGQTVYLRQAIVNYQLAQTLDRTSPNGLVKNDAGQILFNERVQNGTAKKALNYNADGTFNTPVDGLAPVSSATNNANVILKVQPNRTCAKWLSCLTYITDPNNPTKKICLDVGSCDKLGADGNCAHFVDKPSTNTNQAYYPTAGLSISNLSGYSKIGYADTTGKSATLEDYYNLGSMPQTGEKIEINNGGFEGSGGWEGSDCQILNQPNQIDALNLTPYHAIADKSLGNSSYLVPDGRGLLSVPTAKKCTQTDSAIINLMTDHRYVLTFYSYSTDDGLIVKFEDQSGSKNVTLLTVGPNETKNKWIKHTLGFMATATKYKLSFESKAAGSAYIDDVRMDPALNIRCDLSNASSEFCNTLAVASTPPDGHLEAIMPNGHCSTVPSMSCAKDADCPTGTCTAPSTTPRPSLVGSSCRLYAKENSLACSYWDSQTIKHNGVYGYCLESDPKNPATCLLWYPTNRVNGGSDEEGVMEDFGSNKVYYCVDAKDTNSCDGNIPRFYCEKFIEVNKAYYWFNRMSSNSDFKMPNTTVAYKWCSGDHSKKCVRKEDCAGAQTCDSGPELFPEDQIFFKPYDDLLPTNSNRIIDFGVAGGGPVPVKSIDRNSGGYSYFGSYATQAFGSKQYMATSGGDVSSFVSYYGVSTQERCPSSTIPYFSEGNNQTGTNQFFGHHEGDGKTLNWDLGQWDFCAAVEAYDVDFDETKCGQYDCGFNDIQDLNGWPGPVKPCGINDKTCEAGNPGSQYTTKCETSENNGSWQISVTDQNRENDDPACAVYCYNRTQKYQIAKDTNNALEAIKRIFVNSPFAGSPWQLWTLPTGGSAYTSDPNQPNIAEPSKCNGTGIGPRPLKVYKWCSSSHTSCAINADCTGSAGTCIDAGNPDYCYIYPKVINAKANTSTITTSGDLALTFGTQTDPEQLLIKNLTVDWGYKDGPAEVIDDLGHNLRDTIRTITKHLDYNIISTDPNNNGLCHNSICPLNIKIKVTDSWGYYRETGVAVTVKAGQ